MEYACTVWNPHTVYLTGLFWNLSNSMQHIGFVAIAGLLCRSFRVSHHADTCLQELHWPTLSSCQNYLSVSMMHDILHGRYDSLKISNYCTVNSSCARAHSLSFVLPQSTINSHRFSFFVNTISMEHRALPHDILTLKYTKISTSVIPSFLCM